MRARVGATTLLTIGVVATLAGCSSGSDNNTTLSSSSTVTVTASSNDATSEAPTPPTSVISGPRTSANPAGAQRCRAADLSGTVVNRGGGTAGSEYGTLALTNTGSTVCTVTGYPGVSFVGDGNGTQLGAAAVRDGSTVVTASIAPRGVATARIRIAEAGDFPGCDQVRADGLRVYPPGDRDSLFVRISAFTACRSDAQLLTIGTLH